MNFLLCHGWGLDASYWEKALPLFRDLARISCTFRSGCDHRSVGVRSSSIAGYGVVTNPNISTVSLIRNAHLIPAKSLTQHTLHIVDLGYFGKPQPFPTSGTWIGIGHSLGLIKLLQTSLSFSALVGINSFLDFLGPSSIRVKREKILQDMVHSFEQNPLKTLSFFYKQAGIPSRNVSENSLNKESLLNDLKSLFHNYSHLLPSLPCLSLECNDDPIVPLKCGFGKNKGVSRVVFNKETHCPRLDLDEAKAITNWLTIVLKQ